MDLVFNILSLVISVVFLVVLIKVARPVVQLIKEAVLFYKMVNKDPEIFGKLSQAISENKDQVTGDSTGPRDADII